MTKAPAGAGGGIVHSDRRGTMSDHRPLWRRTLDVVVIIIAIGLALLGILYAFSIPMN